MLICTATLRDKLITMSYFIIASGVMHQAIMIDYQPNHSLLEAKFKDCMRLNECTTGISRWDSESSFTLLLACLFWKIAYLNFWVLGYSKFVAGNKNGNMALKGMCSLSSRCLISLSVSLFCLNFSYSSPKPILLLTAIGRSVQMIDGSTTRNIMSITCNM